MTPFDPQRLPPLGGLLVMNKPAGCTSRDVVDQVQRLVRPLKVGHAGTLDPLATGVLVLCLGSATRLMGYVQKMRKRYHATFRLGVTSETDDVESPLEVVEPRRIPAREQVEEALENFRGDILQRPPRYSALKVRGRRAYQRARADETFQLEPRPVTIHELSLVAYHFPELILDVQCSSGTYIRSLGRDLGQQLGTGAVMSALCRRAIGSFRVEDALELDQLITDTLVDRLLPALRAVEELSAGRVSVAQAAQLRHGQAIVVGWDDFVANWQPAPSLTGEAGDPTAVPLVALDQRGALVAIVQWDGESRLVPRKCFPE
jgi:tRNA pseudouridine55 synthase